MTNIGGMNVIVLVIVVSFAIDRIVTGILFSLSFLEAWNSRFRDPRTVQDITQRVRAENIQKLSYFVFAAILAIIVLAFFGNIRILQALNAEDISPVLDIALTGFILVGGSDFLGKLLQMSGVYGGQESVSRPIEISGRLVLEQPSGKQSERGEMEDSTHIG
ncbi:MAG: hypothetical protein ACE10H_10480 [Candidatus Binatia bacterium]